MDYVLQIYSIRNAFKINYFKFIPAAICLNLAILINSNDSSTQ